MSQTKLIRPASVTASNLTSNVPETVAEYSSAATYAAGALVANTSGTSPTYRIYESAIDGNVGNALSDDTKWLDTGPTNRMAMFDTSPSTLTASDSDIDVSIVIDGRADTIGLLNCQADTIQITMTAAGATVYDQTFSMRETAYITDWYAYHTEAITYKPDLVVANLPAYNGCTLRVQARRTTGTRAIGVMVAGLARDLGGTLYGASTGIRDFSRKDTDDFGNVSLVERSYAKTGSFKLVCDAAQADANSTLLADYRATPTLFVGVEGYPSSWIYGWPKDWRNEFAFRGKNYLNLEIEGLI